MDVSGIAVNFCLEGKLYLMLNTKFKLHSADTGNI